MANEAIHNVELEMAILGAILVNNRAVDSLEDLRPDHFYEPLHQLVFQSITTLYRAGREASPRVLLDVLPVDTKIVGDLTASQYLARIAASATSIIGAKDYARSVRHLATLRGVVDIAIDAGAYRERHEFPELAVKEAFARLDELRLDHPSQSRAVTAAEGSQNFLAWMNGVMTGEIVAGGVPTSIVNLDRMGGGLKDGDLIVMGARPGMGKTATAFGFARMAAKAGYGVAGFSLEMSDTQLQARMHCDEAFDDGLTPIAYNHVLNPDKFLNDRDAERLLDAGERLGRMPMMLDYSSSLTIGEITAKTRGMALTIEARHKTRLRLVVVDYLKQVRASDRYRGQRTQEIAEITGGLKQMAKDLNVAVLLLCQLNREVERREDKIPQLADLRDSGDIEADADMVVFLYREAYYIQNNPKIGTDTTLQLRLVECINRLLLVVAKNRHGPTGNVDVFCHMGASAIRNLVRERDPQEGVML